MNSAQANKISIITYLFNQGIEPIKTGSGKAYFLSPLRGEASPSFKVDIDKNIWVDYGNNNIGGTIIDLCMLMNKTDVKGALQILSNIISSSYVMPKYEYLNTDLKIKHQQPIQNRALIQYLENRKIKMDIAKIYLNEVYFLWNDKKYFALSFKNDKGGFELRNKYFKGSTSPKYYTTIKGKKSESLNIFEGFFDFLSALSFYNTQQPGNDTIILNSLAFLDKVIPILPNYTTINLYLDNDKAGLNAVQTIKNQHASIKNQSLILFPNCKDFNEFICQK